MPNLTSTMRWYLRYLVLWGVLDVVQFVYVNAVVKDPANLKLDHWWQVWHPYWFNVLYAGTLIIPVALFMWPVGRAFGGFASAVGRSVLLLGVAAAVWGMGNVVWFVYNVRGQSAPYPSLADAGFLIFLPLVAWALVALTQVLGVSGRDWWLFAALAVAIFVVNGAFVLPSVEWLPDWYGKSWLFSPDYSWVATTISWLYIVVDVVLFSFCVMLLVHARAAAGGVFFAPVLVVAGALAAQYIGDMLFLNRVANGTYFNADISDGFYAASMFLIVVAGYVFGTAAQRMFRGVTGGAEVTA